FLCCLRQAEELAIKYRALCFGEELSILGTVSTLSGKERANEEQLRSQFLSASVHATQFLHQIKFVACPTKSRKRAIPNLLKFAASRLLRIKLGPVVVKATA